MRVSTLQRLWPSTQEADRVIVYDGHGNPIMVAVQLGPDCIKCASVRDADFQEALLLVGIKQPPAITQFQSTLAPP